MKVRALRAHPYAGDNYRRGQEYEILKAKDLKVLVLLKAVEVVGETAPLVVQDGSDIEVEAEAENKPEKKKRRSRNSYSRKDLRAKDDNDFESLDGEG